MHSTSSSLSDSFLATIRRTIQKWPLLVSSTVGALTSLVNLILGGVDAKMKGVDLEDIVRAHASATINLYCKDIPQAHDNLSQQFRGLLKWYENELVPSFESLQHFLDGYVIQLSEKLSSMDSGANEFSNLTEKIVLASERAERAREFCNQVKNIFCAELSLRQLILNSLLPEKSQRMLLEMEETDTPSPKDTPPSVKGSLAQNIDARILDTIGITTAFENDREFFTSQVYIWSAGAYYDKKYVERFLEGLEFLCQ